MRQYNIPHLWRRDIATCGTFPDAFSRNLLWYDWTETQKLHAQSMYNPVFDRLEELCNLKKKHASYFGDVFYGAYFNLMLSSLIRNGFGKKLMGYNISLMIKGNQSRSRVDCPSTDQSIRKTVLKTFFST